MDAFTSAWLAPTMPAKGGLESIGSVRAMHERANAETADTSDFINFQRESNPHADQLCQMYGQETYDEYIRAVSAHCQHENVESAKKLARHTARLLVMRRFFKVHPKIAKLITNAVNKISQRRITT